MNILSKNISARLRSALSFITSNAYPRFIRFGTRVGWWKVALGVVLAVGIVTSLLRGGSGSIKETEQSPRAVSVKSVAELAGGASGLPVVGIVQSQSQAEVRTQSAGEITSVNKKLGDSVRAGEIVASLDNARERAAVLQSEGVLDAANAALSKVSRGARGEQVDILSSNVSSAQSSFATAQTNAVNTLLSAYSAADDSVHRKADLQFSNPESATPRLLILTSDSTSANQAENSRVKVSAILARQSKTSASLSASADINTELDLTASELREISAFFDHLIAALNKSVPSQTIPEATIAAYKADVSAARSTLNGILGSIASAKDTLASRKTGLEVAGKTKEQGVVPDTSDIAATQASVKQAQGALALSRANLEKTIVRAPISGTINSLPLKRGDYVSAFSPAVTIANNNALEVIAYITEDDANEISVGASTRIDNSYDGIITRIAPAVDPATKKIEVRIGIENAPKLVNGKAVTVELSRTGSVTTNTIITIPVSALKIGNNSILVFTVGEGNTLESHEVTLGTLLGDRVEIRTGLTPDMRIVVDARGLKTGQIVSVQ